MSYVRKINKLKKTLIADIKKTIMYHLKNDTIGFDKEYFHVFTLNDMYVSKAFSKRAFAFTNNFFGFHSNGIIVNMYSHGFKVVNYEELSIDDLHDALIFAKKYFKQ